MDPVERIAVQVIVRNDAVPGHGVVEVDATGRVLDLVKKGYLRSMGPAASGPVAEPEIMVHYPGEPAPRMVRSARTV
jgi:hypothetical protein